MPDGLTPLPPPEGPATSPAPQPINGTPSGLTPKSKRLKKVLLWGGLSLLGILLVAGVVLITLYTTFLGALGGDKQQLIPVKIEAGSTPTDIGKLLETKSIIRSSVAFDIYTRLSGTGGSLQAGTYRLSPGESTPDIVKHLVNGRVDQFQITFLPGATLAQHRQVLLDAGYSKSEVDIGLAQTYSSPLLDGKPAGSDLEGYIYGETYSFSSGVSVADILKRTFEQYFAVITDNNLINGFSKQGLTLHDGITLASIVQREASGANDRRQIAQVFLTRLGLGMALGSDVTYQYIADKNGVARDVNLDSPYNTRRYVGLPPGPIASPGLSSLEAVADPASGDYLFFLSGDDNVTYFSRTDAEHQANIRDYCHVKCSTL